MRGEKARLVAEFFFKILVIPYRIVGDIDDDEHRVGEVGRDAVKLLALSQPFLLHHQFAVFLCVEFIDIDDEKRGTEDDHADDHISEVQYPVFLSIHHGGVNDVEKIPSVDAQRLIDGIAPVAAERIPEHAAMFRFKIFHKAFKGVYTVQPAVPQQLQKIIHVFCAGEHLVVEKKVAVVRADDDAPVFVDDEAVAADVKDVYLRDRLEAGEVITAEEDAVHTVAVYYRHGDDKPGFFRYEPGIHLFDDCLVKHALLKIIPAADVDAVAGGKIAPAVPAEDAHVEEVGGILHHFQARYDLFQVADFADLNADVVGKRRQHPDLPLYRDIEKHDLLLGRVHKRREGVFLRQPRYRGAED
ncbi:hypothetical protein SDC9_98417 [bioreactor metagenome]|uniref:Uncharacterized protein n=1 Tax=bioreactor metagenome TaxID=1076179 RepID=A0A645AFD6_9ZZZZ